MAEPPNSGEALKSESRSNNSLTDQVSPYSNIDNNGFNSHENDTKDLTTSSSDVQKDEFNKSITLKVKDVDENNDDSENMSDSQCHLSSNLSSVRSNPDNQGMSSSPLRKNDLNKSEIGTQTPKKKTVRRDKIKKNISPKYDTKVKKVNIKKDKTKVCISKNVHLFGLDNVTKF